MPALSLPPDLWRQVARGTPDPGTLRLLAAARAGRNLLLLRALHQGLRTPGTEILATARRHAPAVFDALIQDPATGLLLADAVRGGRHDAVAVLAAAAGHRAGIPFRLDVPVRDGTLVLPGLGHTTLAPYTTTARVTRAPHGPTVVTADAHTPVTVPDGPGDGTAGWTPVPRLRFVAQGAQWAARLDSHGPPPLGAAQEPPALARWRGRLGAAWAWLAERHPDRAGTVRGTVRAVAPLAPGPPARWLSASFGDAVGLVALAPLDDPAELAAALVHEAQHSLLYALQDLTRLLDAPPGTRGPAPWSERPRPPSALLQGAAAFLATAGFWRTEAAHGNPAAHAPYERWRGTARRAAQQLGPAGWLTADGQRLVDALLDVLTEWDAEGPP
ncbi:HEXXH motif-containing putative peptide modification protein [Streptomyces sp. NPDC020298]|uniref:aKG-HExxH-type peptide beta-hydroxylase n=1 Tax=unclassified Streptomyces TaxID=2593676 RepID=UPI0033F2A846